MARVGGAADFTRRRAPAARSRRCGCAPRGSTPCSAPTSTDDADRRLPGPDRLHDRRSVGPGELEVDGPSWRPDVTPARSTSSRRSPATTATSASPQDVPGGSPHRRRSRRPARAADRARRAGRARRQRGDDRACCSAPGEHEPLPGCPRTASKPTGRAARAVGAAHVAAARAVACGALQRVAPQPRRVAVRDRPRLPASSRRSSRCPTSTSGWPRPSGRARRAPRPSSSPAHAGRRAAARRASALEAAPPRPAATRLARAACGSAARWWARSARSIPPSLRRGTSRGGSAGSTSTSAALLAASPAPSSSCAGQPLPVQSDIDLAFVVADDTCRRPRSEAASGRRPASCWSSSSCSTCSAAPASPDGSPQPGLPPPPPGPRPHPHRRRGGRRSASKLHRRRRSRPPAPTSADPHPRVSAGRCRFAGTHGAVDA